MNNFRTTVLFSITFSATNLAVLQHVHIARLFTVLTALSMAMWCLVLLSMVIRVVSGYFYGSFHFGRRKQSDKP